MTKTTFNIEPYYILELLEHQVVIEGMECTTCKDTYKKMIISLKRQVEK